LRHGLHGTVVIAEVPPRRLVGQSQRAGYHTSRQRKLTPEQGATVRSRTGNATLRELAAEFGVSHETIRTICRRPASK
jgi:DNA-directed RNA polymerase sigma subunit (sigma70/sigma32)